MFKYVWIAFLFMAEYSFGASFYVATDGDNMATGSSAAPWKTIGFGIEQLSAGDTLIVKAGTYTGKANFIIVIYTQTFPAE